MSALEGPPVLGIDRLVADPARWLRGRRVALLANQASLTSGHRPSVDALAAALGGGLVALLTPEHGASGFEEDATAVPDGCDARTGLPVVSLYGPRRRLDAAFLQGLDAVVVDLRDVGVRCYSYPTSVALLLEAAAETGTEVVVCDRPAPLGGRVDGPALEPARRSFLGYLDVPFQHGLTLGEVARFHARRIGGAPLTVLAAEGWERGAPDPATFVPPSDGWSAQHAGFLDEASGDLLYAPAPRTVGAPSVPPFRAAFGAAFGAAAHGRGGPSGGEPGAAQADPRGAAEGVPHPSGELGLGIDAGGSSTRWRLEGPAGAVAEGRLAPLAGHLYDAAGRADAEARVAELAAAVRAASSDGPAAIVAGVTGLTPAGEEAAWLRRALAARFELPAAAVTVLDDVELAFGAAFPRADGVLVYAGTGAIAVALADGQRIRAGGHGYVLDDDGGGFSIGRAALRAVLRRADEQGRAPDTVLARRLYDALGGDAWDRVRAYVYGGGRSAVAALLPVVAQAAAEGDAEARAVLTWAGEELARLARVLLQRCGDARPVALAGGVARVGGALEAGFRAALPAGTQTLVVTDEPVQVAARRARAAATERVP